MYANQARKHSMHCVAFSLMLTSTFVFSKCKESKMEAQHWILAKINIFQHSNAVVPYLWVIYPFRVISFCVWTMK